MPLESHTTALLQSLYSQTVGTPADREAIAIQEFDALHRPITLCMRAAGFKSPMPAYAAEYPGVKTLYPDFTDAVVPVDAAFVDTEALGRSVAVERLLASGHTGRPTDDTSYPGGLTKERKAAFSRQMARCTPSSASFGDVGEPVLARELSGKLIALVEDTLKSDGAIAVAVAAYPRCMRAAGFRITSRIELVRLIEVEYSLIQGTQTLAEAAKTAAWTRETAREHAAARADAGCRADMHSEAMALLATPLRSFQSAHAHDLVLLAAAWEQSRANAAAEQRAWPGLR